MSSKFDNYEIKKTTKYFFSFNNLDGEVGATPSKFNILMNNPSFTNIQSYGRNTAVSLTPLSVVMDLKFFNVSETLSNNKILITSTMVANSPVTITIPNGYYSIFTLASTLQAQLETNARYIGAPTTSMGWAVDIQNAVNLRIRFANAYAGASAITRITFLHSVYNAKSLMGFSADFYDIAYANRAVGITGDLAMDMIPYDTLRICSNVAKRFWVIRNSVLIQSDILLEIPLIDYNLGSTIKWEATDDLYEQDILDDFGNISFSIKDDDDNIIGFDPTAKFNIQFSIKRTITYPSPEEKIRAIQNYASYSS